MKFTIHLEQTTQISNGVNLIQNDETNPRYYYIIDKDVHSTDIFAEYLKYPQGCIVAITEENGWTVKTEFDPYALAMCFREKPQQMFFTTKVLGAPFPSAPDLEPVALTWERAESMHRLVTDLVRSEYGCNKK